MPEVIDMTRNLSNIGQNDEADLALGIEQQKGAEYNNINLLQENTSHILS